MVSRAGVAAGEKACALVWACRARGVGERGTGASAYAREQQQRRHGGWSRGAYMGLGCVWGQLLGGWAEVVFWGGPSRRCFAWGRRLEDVARLLAVAARGVCSWGSVVTAAQRARSGPSVERLVRPVRTGTPARAPGGDERAGLTATTLSSSAERNSSTPRCRAVSRCGAMRWCRRGERYASC